MKSDRLSLASEKTEAQFFAKASGVLLLIVLLIPIEFIKIFAILGLIIAVSKFLFHVVTAISIFLKKRHSRLFQIAVSVVFPMLLSLFFIKDTPHITFVGLFGHMASAWFFLPLLIISTISWVAAEKLDSSHPFRGFLIASTIIFVISFWGYHGFRNEYDGYSDLYFSYRDKETMFQAINTGRYFGQFIIYVFVSYVTMLLKLKKDYTEK